MKLFLTTAIVVLALSPMSAFAGAPAHDHSAKTEAIAEDQIAHNPNEVVIRVSGVVCSFCSQGLQKKLSKLPFVDQSKYKKGVHVSIEDQLVTLAIKADTSADMPAIYKKIKSGGYEPSKAWLTNADGVVTVFEPEDA